MIVIPDVTMAVVLAAIVTVTLIFGAAAGYVLGHRHGLEDDPRLADLPPVPLGDDVPLAPLNPADLTDQCILQARMIQP